ncbi:sulfate transporter/antisigma-factor antagonist STAS [Ectopseudomonas mendocina]|jgi:anti-sigma B factor antagonist|uniref:STAS domain-containing protein n=1 Tax=Ectopseudomonas mendocina TaxID=300 RepID=UPI000206E517|nr:STAS domain-containing protein [Pseudomonas mendocina]AEB60560.1 sulfate transporter/antisigma-factor antagonist STAS [Pseudomonas mendocina NK-01]MDF2075593.1 STAS domain-containing protein [Pseudomonas mendocina]QTN47482.1 STAS domain-containing protein [Pseudomonas mendocina]SUD35710.1 sulfate transporter/antisigma-factor antagonist STAS [Pseudomonas mendocina]
MTDAPGENLYRILPLEGGLTIYSVSEHMELLMRALAPAAEVELDLSALDEVDCAGLQLLVLAKQEASRQGCQLRLSHHSPAVIEAFELSGLASFFGDPILIKPSDE